MRSGYDLRCAQARAEAVQLQFADRDSQREDASSVVGEVFLMSDNFDSYTTHKFDRASLEQYEREQAMSLGKDRVRINFNPSADNLVDTIKQATANLIDLCDQ